MAGEPKKKVSKLSLKGAHPMQVAILDCMQFLVQLYANTRDHCTYCGSRPSKRHSSHSLFDCSTQQSVPLAGCKCAGSQSGGVPTVHILVLAHLPLNKLVKMPSSCVDQQSLTVRSGGEPWTRDIKKPKKRKVKQAQDVQGDEVADEPVILGTGAAQRGTLPSQS